MMVGVKQRYRYRLYPHPRQQVALAKAFGCARVVWNDALAKSRELYAAGEKTSYPVLAKLCITQAKQTPERSWLSGASNVILQQSVRDLDQAFRNWWAARCAQPEATTTAKKSYRFGNGSARVAERFTTAT
jgi:putative transposase